MAANSLTCLFSLYEVGTPEHLNLLNDPALGGNLKKCVRVDADGPTNVSLFLRIPPMQRGHPTHVLHSNAQATTLAPGGAEILGQSNVYVKWAFTPERVAALRREVGFYVRELSRLQGTVVPHLIGFYESINPDENFAVTIFEHCYGFIPSDNAEYHRRYMGAACALHAAGVMHGQLGLSYTPGRPSIDRHVFSDRNGKARIVDFTHAISHRCRGEQLYSGGERERCAELTRLEAAVKERCAAQAEVHERFQRLLR
ncbi:hypothetical protein M0805_002534 [Coniferiporia weirii]|nr:hypothetical protein M0805_002534 [Coniferiporia weirii]